MLTMNAPDSREEFEHNINLLLEQAQNLDNVSKSAIDSFMMFTYPELTKLRVLPNGRINLLTINEKLRLNANTQNFMKNLGSIKDHEEG